MKVIDTTGLNHSPGTGVVLGFDGPSPLAQILRACHADAVANTAGADLTIAAGRGTGTGVGGSILFQTAAAGGAGSTQNALATRVTIDANGSLTVGTGTDKVSISQGGLIVASTLSGTGLLSFDSNGTLSIGATGGVALYRDGSVQFAVGQPAETVINANGTIGFFANTPVPQQSSGANLTNNVQSGGTNDQIDNWTNLSTYSTDAAAIRNAVYQLARKLKQINDGLRAYGLFT
jgi:hypothetical protein